MNAEPDNKIERLEASPRIERIDRAISYLSDARDLFRRAGCNKAADACARALKSAGGALRHAERMESEGTK